PPNLLLILADDLGYGDLACYGNPDIPTPNLDNLASSGLRFTDAYVTAPVCSPSRAGLLTGRYQQRCGHEFNGGDTPGATLESFGLPTSERLLAQDLADAGYVTSLVGKWHLGVAPQFHPLRRGYHECYAFLEAWRHYLNPPAEARPFYRNLDPTPQSPHDLTETLTQEAQAFLHRNAHRPFFLHLAYNAPHTPLEAAPQYLSRFPHVTDPIRRTYYAMVSALDDAVGQLTQTLRDLNLEENTLVLFLVDHGAPSHITPGSNAPLRGHKSQPYEGALRIPFLASWKSHIPPATVCSTPISTLDIYPTLLTLAGKSPHHDHPLDGLSLLPLFDNPQSTQPHHPALYWRMGKHAAIRRGPWKLVRSKEHPWQLYNLDQDIAESHDLSLDHPALAQDLLADFNRWQAQL
ncbi:MAG: sulfatase-like hydrolase/transferase, partial [Phycisphaeraceae bacterium]|nr:sulfatase-like hydrolase/transferase [Phycisphaeraceae bacterium]